MSVNRGALIRLKNAKHLIGVSKYQYLKELVIKGQTEKAMKRLQELLLMQRSNAVKH